MELDAPLFRALAQHGVYPDQIDEWEGWQAAEVLEGFLDRAYAQEHAGHDRRSFSHRTARVTGVAPLRSGRDLIAERIRAHQEGRPAPEADENAGAGLVGLLARFGQSADLHVGDEPQIAG